MLLSDQGLMNAAAGMRVTDISIRERERRRKLSTRMQLLLDRLAAMALLDGCCAHHLDELLLDGQDKGRVKERAQVCSRTCIVPRKAKTRSRTPWPERKVFAEPATIACICKTYKFAAWWGSECRPTCICNNSRSAGKLQPAGRSFPQKTASNTETTVLRHSGR